MRICGSVVGCFRNPRAASLLLTNASGAYCNRPDELTCFAPEWATLHYLNRQFGKKDFISFRNEYFDDLKGQRTGFKTRYTTHTIPGITGSEVLCSFARSSEYDHAYDARAYESGLQKSQLMLAADMIWSY